ncbi:unnamed protein product [Tuber aestivum]|uniref:SEC7 domain-containing protein n=1 Tax=Tuber aestivum TaxID=59557 RepID=A0A292PQH1_9PEZI|nr:unnamed protein product [Tuber aestivum]
MFKRHQGRSSETDLRLRRSLDVTRKTAHARSSEQINRRPCSPLVPVPDVPSGLVSKSGPRFSMLRFRHASDSAIGSKARAETPPPLPATNETLVTPAIITTAPTVDFGDPAPPKRSGTIRLWRQKPSEKQPAFSATIPVPSTEKSPRRSSFSTRRKKEGSNSASSSMRLSRVAFDEPEQQPTSTTPGSSAFDLPPYGDQNSSLPIPAPRLSDSSRSTASSGEHYVTTTTTQTTTTTTTFFRLPRRKKKETSLFPLPIRVPPLEGRPSISESELTPQGRKSISSSSKITPHGSPSKPPRSRDSESTGTSVVLAGLGITGPTAPILRTNSIASTHSAHSSPTSLTPRGIMRGRSSTMSSFNHDGDGRQGGRSSFSGLFGRIRRDSEPIFGGGISRGVSPQPYTAGPRSLAASQEVVAIPVRDDDDTPQMYLLKLFEAVSKSVVASLLARNGDAFHLAVLKVYMATFDFSSVPMDMALRKLLMEVELPSETQQIDRVLQTFADRYHECNPFIYQDSDQAYYVAFSLIMLHTDFFNKNNKHKMQKPDYVKNTSHVIANEGLSSEILECFYHNITYTPFIRMEDEFDINGEKIVSQGPKRGIFNRAHAGGKRPKEPIDPYAVIIDQKLDLLRPSLKDVVQIEDPYSYSGTASRLDMGSLHRAFFRSGVLQIMSARSRPDAFLLPATVENPEGADPGVVELKVTKVGILWRKEMKKKKTRSPWHEWGAILTGSQLYFFRNLSWIKNLMQQYESHHKHNPGTPVTFKPPLEQFKADAQISTDDAVALLDKSYKKHKNAFAFVRHGGMQEYFIADSESEMNDWLAKLNYAATFRSAGVRMRGVVGGNYEGQRARGIRRMDSTTGSPGSRSVQTPSGEVNILRGGIDSQLAAEIAVARREVIEHKISDSEDKLADCNRQLQIHLRNAKHLTILTPIQPKAREQVVMAAGALAAKLQWIRMEMWKLRCHRDILALDSDEERKSERERAERNLAIVTPQVSCQNSPAASIHGAPPASPLSGGPTPTQATFTAVSAVEGSSQVTSPASAQRNGSTCDFTPGTSRSARGSMSSAAPRSPSLSSMLPNGTMSSTQVDDDQSFETGRSRHSPTPTLSESSIGTGIGKEKDEDKEKEREKEKDNEEGKGKGKDKSKAKDKDSGRPKIRRSLQRTLRESQALGHRRGKSRDVSNDDPSKAGEGRPGETEGLARGSGSFTVHGCSPPAFPHYTGKKASVITFGSEWQTLSAEDRLRRNKSNQTGTESDSMLDSESLPSTLYPSRRGSQQPFPRKEDDDVGLPHLPSTNSRRGSHTGLIPVPMRKEDELPGVPEHTDVFSPGAEEKLIEKLNGVKANESAATNPEAGASTD